MGNAEGEGRGGGAQGGRAHGGRGGGAAGGGGGGGGAGGGGQKVWLQTNSKPGPEKKNTGKCCLGIVYTI